ncbi:hypothetical protein [Lysinibacillus sphaericus]|uniref:hypothetical protein n=1 Tax=Lysinibacillus sphaericus TaxID=1421 RepID=UPI000C1A55B9|nr:hypothetical protein [Lysinibacillus sphaericus]PIJ97993.1 hypothetical protein CTN02_09625 [Lysinibacillus sphaericus]
MNVLDLLVLFCVLTIIAVFLLLMVAKKRMDRNEPVFGWKRKQFLEEQKNGGSPTSNTERKVDTTQEDKEHESILDLLELKKIEQGVVERERNEHLVVLSSDFVNFHLLQDRERIAILEGYQQLFNVINFPVQLQAQAVRQDFTKDRHRFEQNLSRVNVHAANYNRDVLDHIQTVTEKNFRITLRIYYIVKYIYEPSKMAKLNKTQREKNIIDNIGLRAEIVRRALRRAKVDATILSSVEAAEVLKRALNRDRIVLHPIEDVQEKEKLSAFVTMDFSTIPDFENLVNNLEEAMDIVGTA